MVSAGADFPWPIEETAKRLYDHYLEHGIDSDDAFATFLSQHNRARLSYGQNVRDRILASGIHAYLRAKDLFLTPYPGVRKTLVELARKNVRCGVVTDAPSLKGWQRLVHLGLSEFFSVVVTHGDTGKLKPDPAPFQAALDALALRPHEVLFVGDWPERDIQGAAALGLRTCFARYGRPDHTGPHGAQHAIDHVGDLLTLLEDGGRGAQG